jgi:IclR family transcriptional regulator, KDG regulon repressor
MAKTTRRKGGRTTRILHTNGEFFPKPAHLFSILNISSAQPNPFTKMPAGGLQDVQHPEQIFYTWDEHISCSGVAMTDAQANPATAVERALNILEVAAQRREGLTNSEISRRLGIPKSSASYILRTLERRGYLRRDAESGRYRLGLKILSLGGDAQGNLDIADVALPFMRVLGEKIRLTVHLAVLDQGEAVYVEKVEAPGFFKVNTWVGRRMFLHSTSVGKCLMAWLPKQDVEAVVKQQGLKKRTPKTIATATKLFAELERVKLAGYAMDDEENSLGARCLGAPIFDATGNVTAAIGASGTLTQMDEANMPKMVEALKETARRVTRQLVRSGATGAA